MKLHHSLVASALVLTLVACSSDSDYDFEANQDALDAQIAASSPPQALFNPDPSNPIVPTPTSLFFSGSMDGTLNIPIPEAENIPANPRVALNQMDGFSTVAPISTPMSEPLNQESLVLGESIRVFEVQTQALLAVTGIDGEVSAPLLSPAAVGNQLVLLPVVPLKPKTDYLVVLTNAITDVDDQPLQASFVYSLLKGQTPLTVPDDMDDVDDLPSPLEPLRQATNSHLQALASVGVEADSVALTWVFRTQSIRDVLQAAFDQADPAPLLLGQTPANTGSDGIGGQGKADIYVGTLEIPYYQSAPTENGDPTPALSGFWQNAGGNVVGTLNEAGAPDYAPVSTGTQTIPVIMTVPNANSTGGGAMPADGWPVTIFQHGITGNRTNSLGIADSMADAGRVVISIDMPLHGITDASNLLHASQSPFNEQERTFDLDLAPNPPAAGETADPNAPSEGPDGQIDDSGDYFYNLRSLPTARDNLRQAIADLFVLGASIDGAQVEGVILNSGNMSFVGHSLGGIVGTTMLSYDSRYSAATLAMPGGGISQLLANSERFGPIINDGLAEGGIVVGSPEYNAFLLAAQTLVDSGDPINHASTLAQDTSTGLHMIEVIGDDVSPNAVPTAPLSGTEPLARLLQLTPTASSTTDNALVRFSAGGHSSILRPGLELDDDATAEMQAQSLEVTIEMQSQTALFALSQGAELTVTNTSVIQPVE